VSPVIPAIGATVALTAAIGVGINVLGGPPRPEPQTDKPYVQSMIDPKPEELPADITGAIDLEQPPTIVGQWLSSEMAMQVDDAAALVTPCGQVVTSVSPDGFAFPPILTALDPTTGGQRWNVDLFSLIGSGWIEQVSYTGCSLVLNLEGSNYATIVIDEDGAVSMPYDPVEWQYDTRCFGADGHLACYGTKYDESLLQVFSVDDLTVPVVDESMEREGYEYKRTLFERVDEATQGEGLAIGSWFLTEAGYRNAKSDEIAFGADTHIGSAMGGGSDALSVVYTEVKHTGGYDTGLVMRVSGAMNHQEATCLATLWDPIEDRPLWPEEQSVGCGPSIDADMLSTPRFFAVGDRLIADDSGWELTAFDLASGEQQWEDDDSVREGWNTIPYDAELTRFDPAVVLAEYDDSGIRLSDGETVTLCDDGDYCYYGDVLGTSEGMFFVRADGDEIEGDALIAHERDWTDDTGAGRILWEMPWPGESDIYSENTMVVIDGIVCLIENFTFSSDPDRGIIVTFLAP
jgi:hypothetical protein